MNIGSRELLLFLVTVGLVVIVVLAVTPGQRRSGSGTRLRNHTALVSDPSPDTYIQRAAIALAGLPLHSFSGVGASTLVITRQYTAGWRVVVAIIAFPFGLLALVGHDEETATVAATWDGQQTRVTLSGPFSGPAVDRLNVTLN
ncbi:MAG: hypothetical protein ABIV94_01965 [Acidimicrobiales bacterium]